MPYIKPRDPPFAALGRLLKGYDLNAPKLAGILDCSTPTARRRLKEPELLTLGDLVRISQRGHIPMEEIREAIRR